MLRYFSETHILEIDEERLSRAQNVLGTTGVKDTIERALDEVLRADLRWQLAALSSRTQPLVIAACAEAAAAVVWHYDEDYDRIARITGQAVEWIAPRGTLR
jgi:hypothetical protein